MDDERELERTYFRTSLTVSNEQIEDLGEKTARELAESRMLKVAERNAYDALPRNMRFDIVVVSLTTRPHDEYSTTYEGVLCVKIALDQAVLI